MAAAASPPRPPPLGRPTLAAYPLPFPAPPQLRYANNSQYKNDTMIRKECFVSQAVLDELKRIIEDSEVGAGGAGVCGAVGVGMWAEAWVCVRRSCRAQTCAGPAPLHTHGTPPALRCCPHSGDEGG